MRLKTLLAIATLCSAAGGCLFDGTNRTTAANETERIKGTTEKDDANSGDEKDEVEPKEFVTRGLSISSSEPTVETMLAETCVEAKQLTLVSAWIPDTLYTISAENNRLHVIAHHHDGQSTPYEFKLPLGNYPHGLSWDEYIYGPTGQPEGSLAETIASLLAKETVATWGMVYDSNLNSYAIEHDAYDNESNAPVVFSLDASQPFSVLPSLGYSPAMHTGQITGLVNNVENKPKNVSGTNTEFTRELTEKAYVVLSLEVQGQGTQYFRYRVMEIISDTEIELDSPVVQLTDATMYNGRLLPQDVQTLDPREVLLTLSYGNDASNKTSPMTAVVPLGEVWTAPTDFLLGGEGTSLDVDWLNVEVTDLNGTPVVFNGPEMLLQFHLQCLAN